MNYFDKIKEALSSKLNKQNTSVGGAVHSDPKNEATTSKDNKLEKLQHDLKKAIAEERYEDAAKIRDEINKTKDIN